jgi:hypothetical protein
MAGSEVLVAEVEGAEGAEGAEEAEGAEGAGGAGGAGGAALLPEEVEVEADEVGAVASAF